jgi:predicted Zn-dependent protease
MKELFLSLTEHAIAQLRGTEVLLVNFAGEQSDFVRFNQGRVRQPMTVRQASLTLDLIDAGKRDTTTLTVSGDPAQDRSAVAQSVRAMRDELAALPVDPYLLYQTEATASERERSGALPTAEQAIDDVIRAADGADLVGILASGPIYRGFANSLGSRHWHEVPAFLFDWSLYHSTDKAVKSTWAAAEWTATELQSRVSSARELLAYLARPARSIEPGEYRAYLAPGAVDELLWMFNWDGVSFKAQRTKQSCLQMLVDGERALSPLFSLREDVAGGLAPCFDASGFTKPATIELITEGRHAGSMVSARTAREYGLQTNGADDDESMQSMQMDGGTLPSTDALAALDTGIAIGNLHYLNFSDRANARITGLTRFATFWVEGGRIVAPVNVMRWDDTLYRMLGEHLEALTAEPEWILNSLTYGQRSVQTSRVPGALLSRLAFTL